MRGEETSQDRHRRRRPNACVTCRDRKVRCSGTHPCTNCVRRSTDCTFEPDDRKVTVTERFLNDLKRKASQNELGREKPRKRLRECASDQLAEREISNAEIVGPLREPRSSTETQPSTGQEARIANPLVSGKSRVCIDDNGRRRFLGPSSTWAYTRQVIVDIKNYLDEPDSPEAPLYVDGNAYDFDWSLTGNEALTKQELPSFDHALYLMNTVKFHVAQLYHLFDETVFIKHLHQFYDPSPPDTRDSGLWYIQYLLVIAFGKTFLAQRTPGDPPPGTIFFARAMKLLPDIKGLYEDTLMSIEILCGISLYLQCIDHRNSAYVYLGIALRIALSQGLHREVDMEPSAGSSARYRSVWWTLYILDRRFSSLMGAPVSIHDADVTVPLPSSGDLSEGYEALAMHVKLSRVITSVLNSVYGLDGRLNLSFVKRVQEVLLTLATLAPELETHFGLTSSRAEPISRVAGTLNLCYHQCVVLATRPLLVYLLFDKLSDPSINRTVTNSIKALTKACFDSAEKSLRILSALRSQDLLEAFHPFDIDCTHSSAFVLLLITAIGSNGSTDHSMPHIECAEYILDTMIQRGSVPAKHRNSELKVLQELLRLLENQTARVNLAQSSHSANLDAAQHDSTATGDIVNDQSLDAASFSQHVNAMGDTGLSPDEMLEVARLLEWGNIFPEESMSMPQEQLWNIFGDTVYE